MGPVLWEVSMRRAAHEPALADLWLGVIGAYPRMRAWVAHNKIQLTSCASLHKSRWNVDSDGADEVGPVRQGIDREG